MSSFLVSYVSVSVTSLEQTEAWPYRLSSYIIMLGRAEAASDCSVEVCDFWWPLMCKNINTDGAICTRYILLIVRFCAYIVKKKNPLYSRNCDMSWILTIWPTKTLVGDGAEVFVCLSGMKWAKTMIKLNHNPQAEVTVCKTYAPERTLAALLERKKQTSYNSKK